MHKRVAELFEDRLVDLGLLARDREIDLLAKLLAHITHETRETIKREADWQHANSEHALLELARVTGQLDQTIAELIDFLLTAKSSPIWLSIDCVMTSSPTMLISASIF